MSTNYSIYDTSMPNNWSEMMMYEFEWDLRPEFAAKVLDLIFTATAEILASAKLRDKPVTLVYRKANKEIVAAATVQFFANEEDPTKPGNWSLVWTFNASDIPENAQIIEGTDSNVYVYYKAVAGSKFNFEYELARNMFNTSYPDNDMIFIVCIEINVLIKGLPFAMILNCTEPNMQCYYDGLQIRKYFNSCK